MTAMGSIPMRVKNSSLRIIASLDTMTAWLVDEYDNVIMVLTHAQMKDYGLELTPLNG